MQSKWKFHAAMCGLCVVLACDGAARDPVAPNLVSTSVSPAVAVSELASSGGPKAGGHADIHGTIAQGVRDETYSFIAIAAGPPPGAKGHVEIHLLGFNEDVRVVSAEVTCISVLGNQAWVGGRVRRSMLNGQVDPFIPVGQPITFRVQDNGEGHGITELASLVFFAVPPRLPPGSSELDYCSTRLEFPILRESTNGNIQVKPD